MPRANSSSRIRCGWGWGFRSYGSVRDSASTAPTAGLPQWESRVQQLTEVSRSQARNVPSPAPGLYWVPRLPWYRVLPLDTFSAPVAERSRWDLGLGDPEGDLMVRDPLVQGKAQQGAWQHKRLAGHHTIWLGRHLLGVGMFAKAPQISPGVLGGWGEGAELCRLLLPQQEPVPGVLDPGGHREKRPDSHAGP